jgi:hypothetical protein
MPELGMIYFLCFSFQILKIYWDALQILISYFQYRKVTDKMEINCQMEELKRQLLASQQKVEELTKENEQQKQDFQQQKQDFEVWS